MLKAQEVAHFFLSPTANVGAEGVCNLKLQKLLYYAQGYSLALLGKPLFAERIVHWEHGPVVESVYRACKGYGASALPHAYVDTTQYATEALYVMRRVQKEKGCYSAWTLRNMTHEESPWACSKRDEVISTEKMRAFFSEHLACRDGFNFDLERISKRVEGDFKQVPVFDSATDLLSWLQRA